MNLSELQQRLESVRTPEDLFGPDLKPGHAALARLCHPDLHPNGDHALAAELFRSVEAWRRKADYKRAAGTYGDRAAPHTPPPPYTPTTLTVGRKPLTLTGRLAEGTYATLHRADYPGAPEAAFFLEVARDPRDNDLLEREFKTLRTLMDPDPHPGREAFFIKQRDYVPRPYASFFIADASGKKRRANLLAVRQGHSFTARELRETHFPTGLPPAHVYWIFRRLLLTLWMAHLKGCVHGAVTPDHVLVYPDGQRHGHGLVLLDWCCAAKIEQEHVPAIDPAWEKWMPLDLLHRAPAQPSMDLYMAGGLALYLLADQKVPPTVREAIDFLRRENPDRRPRDAERYYSDFEKVIEAAHGPRRFVEFRVP